MSCKVHFTSENLPHTDSLQIEEGAERMLALKLLAFSETLASIEKDLGIHRFCNYLYEVASTFHKFYEQCPILNCDDLNTKNTRLTLCRTTAKILETGLDLLGIQVLEKM